MTARRLRAGRLLSMGVCAGFLIAGALASCEREVLLGHLDELADLGDTSDAARSTDLALPRIQFLSPVEIAATVDPRFIKSADVDRDSHLDLIVTDGSNKALYTLRGRGDGTFARPQPTSSDDIVSGLLVADFDEDRRPDLAVLLPRPRVVQILPGRGDGTFSAGTGYATDMGTLAVSDFNRDGRPDVVVASQTEVTVVQSGALGVGFEPLTPLRFALPGPAAAVAAGDLDRDLFPDFVVAMASQPAARVYVNMGGTSFRERVDALPETSQTLALLRLDGSGALSGLITTPAAVVLLATNGAALTEDPKFSSRFPIGKNPRSLEGADLDRDGHLDLIAAGSEPSLSVLFGTGRGDFERSGLTISLPSAPRSFAVGDWNEDRVLDVAVVTDSPPSVELRFGTPPRQ